MPSIPLARKAMVTAWPGAGRASRASMRPWSASASADSLVPQVRSTRLTMTDLLAGFGHPAPEVGQDPPGSNISAIS